MSLEDCNHRSLGGKQKIENRSKAEIYQKCKKNILKTTDKIEKKKTEIGNDSKTVTENNYE